MKKFSLVLATAAVALFVGCNEKEQTNEVKDAVKTTEAAAKTVDAAAKTVDAVKK